MSLGWDIRRIYMYLVCFATLMMIIFGTVQIVNGIVNFAYPEQFYYPDGKLQYAEMKKADPDLTREEFEKQIKEERKIQENNQKRWRLKNLIQNFALLIVALPIYLYHWRKIQQAEAI